VVVDRCHEGGAEATDQLLGARAKILAEFEPGLLSLPGQDAHPEAVALPPEAAQRRALGALAETLRQLALESPLLLILDDLQWADELTFAFLESLSSRFFESNRVVLLGLYRREEMNHSLRQILRRQDVRAITLDRLPEQALATMVSDMLAMPQPPDALIRFITEHSEGNPFFAAEYLRLLVAEQIVQRRASAWTLADGAAADEAAFRGLELPRSIKEIVGRRFAQLRPAERGVVEGAAVLGRAFDDETLAMVMDMDEPSLGPILRQLTARQILEQVAPGSHRFVHDKLRSVAFEEISPQRRRQLHGACGRALEARLVAGTEQHLPELAYHFGQAGERAKASEYLEKAAQRALSQFANSEAARYYRELLDRDAHPLDDESALRRARWERGLGDALHGLGQLDSVPDLDEHDTSRSHLEKALLLLGHPLPRGPAMLSASLLGQLVRQVGHRLFPERFVGRGSIDRVKHREASQAYDRLLQIFYYGGRQLEMLYATFKTLNLAELAGPSPELAMAYSIAHAVAGIIPLRSLADGYLERANDILKQTPDSAVDSYLQLLTGVYRSGTTEWTRARDAFDRGLALATSLSFDRRCDELNLGLANWNFLRGRFAEARRHCDAQASSFSRGDPQAQAWQLLMQAQVNLVRGETAQALEHARQAHHLAIDTDQQAQDAAAFRLPRSELIWTFATLAAASARCGATEDAQTHAHAALRQILAGPPVTFYCIESYSIVCDVFLSLWRRAAERGEPTDSDQGHARKACRALGAFARVFPAAKSRALLHAGTLEHLQGRVSRAQSLWRSSAETAKAHEMPHEANLAHWTLARSQGRARRTSELARIVRDAEQLEAFHLASRAQDDLDGKSTPDT
jgi:hypothetical protein